MLGYDAAAGRAIGGGRLAATPMARIREATAGCPRGTPGVAEDASGPPSTRAWHAPDPVALARPVTDLGALFTAAAGRRTADRGRDDRRPRAHPPDPRRRSASTARSMRSRAPTTASPSSRPATWSSICARLLGTAPDRTAVVGDSPADLAHGPRRGRRAVLWRAHRRRHAGRARRPSPTRSSTAWRTCWPADRRSERVGPPPDRHPLVRMGYRRPGRTAHTV